MANRLTGNSVAHETSQLIAQPPQKNSLLRTVVRAGSFAGSAWTSFLNSGSSRNSAHSGTSSMSMPMMPMPLNTSLANQT